MRIAVERVDARQEALPEYAWVATTSVGSETRSLDLCLVLVQSLAQDHGQRMARNM
jgi:hypothetical protein